MTGGSRTCLRQATAHIFYEHVCKPKGFLDDRLPSLVMWTASKCIRSHDLYVCMYVYVCVCVCVCVCLYIHVYPVCTILAVFDADTQHWCTYLWHCRCVVVAYWHTSQTSYQLSLPNLFVYTHVSFFHQVCRGGLERECCCRAVVTRSTHLLLSCIVHEENRLESDLFLVVI